MVVVASKTGWSEDYVRWHLPLWRGWAYYHAARLLEGERCRWPDQAAASAAWIDDLRQTLSRNRT